MPEQSIRLILRDNESQFFGELLITSLPGRQDVTVSARGGSALREGATYRYEIKHVTDVEVEPRELFDPDDASWTQGRLNPAQAVGRLRIQVTDRRTRLAGTADIDVLAVKLDHETEYRQMLTDISAFAAEAVLQGFAPSSLSLSPSELPAELLYLRFAMIAAYLQDPAFEAAIARVTSQPHHTWISEQEIRPVGSSFPSGSGFRRAALAPGRRVRWENGPAALKSLPAALARDRTEATVDNSANQFVKFALEGWREVATELLDTLSRPSQKVETGPLRRGRQTANDVAEKLDEYLAHPLFRGVSSLRRMPTSDQVLLKRAGYREIFRTFAMTKSGPIVRIDHENLTDLFAASQRNVATLYEFWCFLALVDSVGRVCGEARTAQVFTVAGDGLSMSMQSGSDSKITWIAGRGSRRLQIEAFFNRSFGGADDREGSWTRKMRPDCSIRIKPEGSTPSRVSTQDLEVWLHFDAKYRVDNPLADLAIDPDLDEPLAESPISIGPKTDDLLKMHAYRDAISQTAGAYVLYPGSMTENILRHPGFEEILPGLGAFPLRPSADGLATASRKLDQFLGDVLTHVASQVTRDERHRYWTATVDRPGGPILTSSLTTDFLEEPPADTDVLLGFIRSPEQRQWIEQMRQYNIRAGDRVGAVEIGGRELGARLILLYERRDGSLHVTHAAKVVRWRPASAADLTATGYPNPQGDLYFVANVELVENLPKWADLIDLEALLSKVADGAPTVVTWWDVVRSASIVEA